MARERAVSGTEHRCGGGLRNSDGLGLTGFDNVKLDATVVLSSRVGVIRVEGVFGVEAV
jgi:hypothetical protein